MNVLALSCGISTMKCQVIAADLHAIRSDSDRRLARAQLTGLGDKQFNVTDRRVNFRLEPLDEVGMKGNAREVGRDGIDNGAR